MGIHRCNVWVQNWLVVRWNVGVGRKLPTTSITTTSQNCQVPTMAESKENHARFIAKWTSDNGGQCEYELTTPLLLWTYVLHKISRQMEWFITFHMSNGLVWAECSASHEWVTWRRPYASAVYTCSQPISREVTHTHICILPTWSNKRLLAKGLHQKTNKRKKLWEHWNDHDTWTWHRWYTKRKIDRNIGHTQWQLCL